MARKKALPWRVQSGPEGDFDELVVHSLDGGPCLIHAEMMNERSIFVTVGDLAIWAYVDKGGHAKVTNTERRKQPKKKPAQRQSAARGDE